MTLCEKKLCCGCGACESACKTNAIEMLSDECGFTYPVINEEKCVHCGLCTKVCPILKEPYGEKQGNVECYVGQLKDIQELQKSQSGGAFWALAAYTIKKGGVVYGCAYKGHFVAAHIRAETLEECGKMRGSKYVQSDTIGIFVDVKKDLEKGRHVLFSGTPCQCAGLQAFLAQDYETLIVCDIICHGVASPLLSKLYVEEIEKKEHSRVCTFHYRYYDGYNTVWGMHNNNNTFENGKCINNNILPDMYYSHAFFRDSCYNCKFCTKIVSDITIADAWGVQEFGPASLQINMGVSEMLLYPTAGKKNIYNILQESMNLYEASYTDIVKNQPHLAKPVQASSGRVQAWKCVRKYGVIKSHQIMKWKSFCGNMIRKMIRKN